MNCNNETIVCPQCLVLKSYHHIQMCLSKADKEAQECQEKKDYLNLKNWRNREKAFRKQANPSGLWKSAVFMLR